MATVNSIKEIPALDADARRRFWLRVSVRGDDECWPWLASTASGYGRFYLRRREFYLATRVSWFLNHGEQPGGFCCHRCDNPICVNPAHLWIGDATANNRDREQKNRGGWGSRTACKHGHSLADAEIYRGWRRCRECARISSAKRYAKETVA